MGVGAGISVGNSGPRWAALRQRSEQNFGSGPRRPRRVSAPQRWQGLVLSGVLVRPEPSDAAPGRGGASFPRLGVFGAGECRWDVTTNGLSRPEGPALATGVQLQPGWKPGMTECQVE